MEKMAPTGADDDAVSVAVTVTSAATTTEAVAEAADAKPAEMVARTPPLTPDPRWPNGYHPGETRKHAFCIPPPPRGTR